MKTLLITSLFLFSTQSALASFSIACNFKVKVSYTQRIATLNAENGNRFIPEKTDTFVNLISVNIMEAEKVGKPGDACNYYVGKEILLQVKDITEFQKNQILNVRYSHMDGMAQGGVSIFELWKVQE